MDLQLINENDKTGFPVDSKILHKGLAIDTYHSTWIARRLEDFVEGQDFLSVLEESGGRPEKVFMLTVDAAKHIAMMERTDKGKEVRQYFIEVERKAKRPMTQIELAMWSMQRLVDQEKQLLAQQEALEKQEKRITAVESSASYESIHKMVKDSLIEETINVFPENCSRLEVIRETVFNGISEAVISKFLTHINHPTKEYKFKMADNILRSITVFSNIGLADAYNRLRAESIYQKTTKKNVQFTHPIVGNYRVKILEASI